MSETILAGFLMLLAGAMVSDDRSGDIFYREAGAL
jgi:hypothetical protein